MWVTHNGRNRCLGVGEPGQSVQGLPCKREDQSLENTGMAAIPGLVCRGRQSPDPVTGRAAMSVTLSQKLRWLGIFGLLGHTSTRAVLGDPPAGALGKLGAHCHSSVLGFALLLVTQLEERGQSSAEGKQGDPVSVKSSLTSGEPLCKLESKILSSVCVCVCMRECVKDVRLSFNFSRSPDTFVPELPQALLLLPGTDV